MKPKKLLALYGLKWNPFTPDVPQEALLQTPRIASFCARVQNLVEDGGFALVTGDPGNGKSVILRVLHERLSALRDVSVGRLTRPQSNITDIYRELGEIFGVNLRPGNRWGGFKMLRERWKSHLEASLVRPVLLVDEAQEMNVHTLSELRLLSSAEFDSVSLLTVVLAGDQRLVDHLRHPNLIPLGSRIRTRIVLSYQSPDELTQLLEHAIQVAGNPKLMTKGLIGTLVEHSAGNQRALMTMAGEMLMAGAESEVPVLDEKLYFEVFHPTGGVSAS
jgi:type II secretory pathway predicted ATPase ExeA